MRPTRISFFALTWVFAAACGESQVELHSPDTGARDAAWADRWTDDGRPSDSTNPAAADSSMPDAPGDGSPDTGIRDTLPGDTVLDARDSARGDAAVDTAAVTDVRDAPTTDARDASASDTRDAPATTDAVNADLLDGGDTSSADTDSSSP